MTILSGDVPSRREMLAGGAAAAGLMVLPGQALAMAPNLAIDGQLRPALLRQALNAMSRHAGRIRHRDVIGIADFASPSRAKRFHLVDVASGRATSLLVSHGKGSDPAHSGWLTRFSNVEGSEASCEGAFVTANEYVGKHGRSQRLVGLDPTNNNAEQRAIVVHGAWYVSPDMVRQHGKLGRSQGCFAFDQRDLAQVMARLGPGRMLYAAKA